MPWTGRDFVKFIGSLPPAGAGNYTGQGTAAQTINTTPGGSSSMTTNGLKFIFVPTIDGNGTSIRMEIKPEDISNIEVTKPFRGTYAVPSGGSLFIGFHSPTTGVRPDQLLIVTPRLTMP